MRQLHRTVTAIAALALLGLAAPASPAAAAAGDVYCVARVNGEAPQATCFDTFDKALQFASGGVLVDLPKGSGTVAKVEAMNAGFGTFAVNTVISIDYTGINFTGSALIWTGSSGNCSGPLGNIDYQIPSMPAGWDNVVSSYRTFANCWVKHYELTNYGGASIGYSPTDANIGAAMDNRTSSERWS
ncbi:peptidase inhibitor family I36 protein [Catellatospora citrea]|uniref:peptidase inhibitor family I36 protein n=1 Tax=Catellatospora citrea TaxID=53366 RepID=UPI0033C1041B